ncbi:hypothetical protein LZZ85_03900 [Terrimonas sp. NA20]|uniref:Vitamin K epoxide reductase domain-containing protein n=1 Tax=Terrimonas ginsenosidimutans TaxID=2908004 RepID=A0ABS9KM54_9BACT|nr:vitamin K epoxide reductase family protein [Terrimonas ginsenosidimutans]MCG2613405.1 hypothetical protein [Terrimonas ginsenosidimutans]
MQNELSQTFYHWLSQLKIPVSFSYIHKKLLSHPDYPSMLAFTDILDDLSIDNAVYVVDRSAWNDLPFPFLAHTPKNGGQFILVQKNDPALMQKGGALEHWEGIGLFAERPEGWTNKEIDKINRGQRVRKNTTISIFVMLLVLSLLTVDNTSPVKQVLLLVATFLGVGLSLMILQKELGVPGKLVQKLCGSNKEYSCDNVLLSHGSKLLDWFSWTDAGVIFFTVFLLLITRQNVLVPAFSVAAVPFVFFSLYYQWRVIRKWCRLCLLTLFVLSVQFVLQIPAIGELSNTIPPLAAFAEAAFVLLLVSSLWLAFLRPLIQDKKKLEEDNYVLQRFRNNTNIFRSMLGLQRRVDTQPWEHDLQLGDSHAATQIVVACSLYCGPCANAHDVLHELAIAKGIGVTVRFSINPEMKEDRRTVAVTYLLQVLNGRSIEYKRKALHDWYKHMDADKFRQQYPLEDPVDVGSILTMHGNWNRDAAIVHTPTIFINGREMPEEYAFTDLLALIKPNEVAQAADIPDRLLPEDASI